MVPPIGLIEPTATNLPTWIRKAAERINWLLRTTVGENRAVRSVTESGSVADGDYFLTIDASAGNIIINLPPAAEGRELAVKRMDATANAVTLATTGSDTIDGGGAMSMTTQYQAFTLIAAPGQWCVI